MYKYLFFKKIMGPKLLTPRSSSIGHVYNILILLKINVIYTLMLLCVA